MLAGLFVYALSHTSEFISEGNETFKGFGASSNHNGGEINDPTKTNQVSTATRTKTEHPTPSITISSTPEPIIPTQSPTPEKTATSSPRTPSEQIITRDNSGEYEFDLSTYVGLGMIIIILFILIGWKFCPSCTRRNRREDLFLEDDLQLSLNDDLSVDLPDN